MHTRAKISVTFWLIASALAAVFALTWNLRSRYEIQIYQATALGILLVLAWRLWAVRQLRKNQELNAHGRLQGLEREVRLLHRPVRIEGMPPTLWLVFGILITTLLVMISLGTDEIKWLVFATLTVIATGIAMLIRIAKLGQPLLIVSREGVQPAGYGLLPWSAIYGIECHTPEGRHASGMVLNLFVPGLKTQLHSAHPFIRFFRSIPGIRAAKYVNVIMIPLRKPSELPHVIERLCRSIWKNATGRTHHWSIHLSGSEMQYAQLLADTRRKMDAPQREEDLEQVREEMENLQRHAQVARDETRAREAWARVWTVPGIIAFPVVIGQVPLGRLIAFVPTHAWSMQALAIAIVLVIVAWSLVLGHARNVFGESFTRKRLVQTLVTMGFASILVLPATWLLLTDVGGAMAAIDSNRPKEEITVIATKTEHNTRGGCDYFLSHPGLGKRMCLVYAEFLDFPEQVPVELLIRRNALGYRVYEQRVVLLGRE